jgi:hypothetical protein
MLNVFCMQPSVLTVRTGVVLPFVLAVLCHPLFQPVLQLAHAHLRIL